ncbi:MAG: YdcF family protein [Candidatus Puniceispirillum sp.]
MADRTTFLTLFNRFRNRGTALTVSFVFVAFILASFQHFVLTLPRGEADFTKLDHTDGIVVTTGGQQRLVEGLNLLVSGTTDKLLISGVGKGVNKAVLVQELNLNDQQVSALFCCVELEYGALDTRGNALAARAWIEQNSLKSIRLVTANYHMPRAEIVFSRAIPDVDIHQWAVSPDALDIERWWQDPVIIRLLTREYAKYVTEIIRL